MKGFCENCGHEAELTEGLCPECRGPREGKGVATAVSGMVAGMAGLEPIQGFSFQRLLSEVFQKHSESETERFWAQGAPGNIPALSVVDTGWPRPWMFVRCALMTAVLYGLFLVGYKWFHNANFLPGLIFVGTFAVPLTLLVFFFEMNARRNVSLSITAKAFLMGGTLSLVVSLPLAYLYYILTPSGVVTWLGASSAGIVEEIAKLAVVLFLAGRLRRLPYLHNGLLLGAAVGTGFAAFESAGYVLRYLIGSVVELSLSNQSQIIEACEGNLAMLPHLANDLCALCADTVYGVIRVRLWGACLGTHILWTGIAAAGMWLVKGKEDFQFGMLFSPKFLRLFLISVVSHMLWNSPLNGQFPWLAYVIGGVDWLVVFALLSTGLKQLREEKAGVEVSSVSSREEGVAAAVREDSVVLEAISAADALHPAPLPTVLDPLGIREEVRESAVREREREAPRYQGRAWQKYYKKDR